MTMRQLATHHKNDGDQPPSTGPSTIINEVLPISPTLEKELWLLPSEIWRHCFANEVGRSANEVASFWRAK